MRVKSSNSFYWHGAAIKKVSPNFLPYRACGQASEVLICRRAIAIDQRTVPSIPWSYYRMTSMHVTRFDCVRGRWWHMLRIPFEFFISIK
jgi:hypothetical protein